MKELFDDVSIACSKYTTRAYSTSFSLGIYCLDSRLHAPIYSIYGFVRFADEIVDTFHQYDKKELFSEFRDATWKALDRNISLNPILNSFQRVVKDYNIERELIECFLNSMEADLQVTEHSENSYKQYILGSAEAVGLMCLRVFTENDKILFNQLKHGAMKLGAAFQKVNFLRDLNVDCNQLGRVYFPGVNFDSFNENDKRRIEKEIEQDFAAAYEGIRMLPKCSKLGVYVAYVYYKKLYNKIKATPSNSIFIERIRISNPKKMRLMVSSYFKYSLSMI